MKAVILVRVSSKEQEDNHSFDAQQEKLEAYCEQKGFEKPEVFRIIESSTQGERKKFNQMIKWIEQQDELVYLVVDAVDRLQRSFKETIVLTDMMKAKQLELHFLKENLILNEEANPMQVMMWITQNEYDKKATELKQEKKDLELEIQQFDNADETFAITVQYLLALCSKAHELFKSSKAEQKRQLINFVLSNLELDGERLHYDLNKPFDVIAQSCKSSEWYTR